MRITLKRGLAGATAIAAVATVAPIIVASPASAATNIVGSGGTISLAPPSGAVGTSFNFNLTGPGGAAAVCPGDNNAGYKFSTFIIPAAADPASITFSGAGAVTAVPGEYRNNLYAGSTAVRNRFPDPVSATITGVPTMQFQFLDTAAPIPDGAYQVGIACHGGPTGAAPSNYWAKTITISHAGGDFYVTGAAPSAPVITTAATTTGDGTVHAVFTAPPADPAVSSYTATLTGTGPTVGTNFSQSGAASPIDFTGVAYGTYDLTVTATSGAGTSAPSAAVPLTVAPGARPAPVPVSWTAGSTSGTGILGWTTPTGVAPTGYTVDITGPTTSSQTVGAVTSVNLSGLAVGTYSATVTPLHPAPFVGTPATIPFSVFASQVLIQDITVTRPAGALVLTQVCGSYGALDAETAQLGFPAGLGVKTAVNSAAVGAPVLPNSGIPTGENGTSYGQYPYPTNPDGTPNATYPTRCGIDLSNAKFVTNGAGAGQFFATEGRLNQVTVVNTQDADTPWNVVGQVSNFASSNDSFSGSQLGWTPKWTDDTGPFTDSLGLSYDMSTVIGDPVAPNTNAASGLSVNHTLIRSNGFQSTGAASSTGGLGTAIADARLKLLIPITAQSGVYTATLTISTL